ncbi:hypothetical protein [Limihaloglobus sulfuriphilus]|uniref:hypothetical protein n=1 Tax=Limihaloglobus sulfuriphilus TaxID=1851148 RepID=UPI0011BA971B|nr:hypothetical protein [Limihaloglobus sulfuriphilus]
MPSAANWSMFGVIANSSPQQPKCGVMSSVDIHSMLGRCFSRLRLKDGRTAEAARPAKADF